MPVINAKDLYKCYSGFSPVLKGANLEVEAGEMVAIMGPSGCGKSTMLHILGLLHAPDSGELTILDSDVLALDREQTAAFRRENLGFVMQSSNLFDHSTVFENVEFPLIYDNVPPQERWERVIRALDLVRLSSRVHYRSNRLSGGEQQRVAIARAMVNNPRILFADEPTGALDAHTSVLIMENFRALCHDGGVSMVMVTHDSKMAAYCDSVYTLEEGQLVCKERKIPALGKISHSFLSPPPALVRSALVARRFPQKKGTALMGLAELLHKDSLLSRIYSLTSNIFAPADAYSLPLAVRKLGFADIFRGLRSCLRHKNSSHEKKLWETLARAGSHGPLKRLWLMACGEMLALWSQADSIEFFFAYGCGSAAQAAWLAAHISQKNFAFVMQAKDFQSLPQDLPQLAKDASFICCSTSSAAHYVGSRCQDAAAKIMVLPESVAFWPPEDDTFRQAEQGSGEKLTILASGPLEPGHGYDLLVQACAGLRQDGLKLQLTILGKGSAAGALRRLAKRLGLGANVQIISPPPAEDLPAHYMEADIYVDPYKKAEKWQELDFPLALAEAMAFRLAIVATRLPGVSEVLANGVNSLLVPENDLPALAEALKVLAASPEKRERLGLAAQTSIRQAQEKNQTDALLVEKFRNALAHNPEKITVFHSATASASGFSE